MVSLSIVPHARTVYLLPVIGKREVSLRLKLYLFDSVNKQHICGRGKLALCKYIYRYDCAIIICFLS